MRKIKKLLENTDIETLKEVVKGLNDDFNAPCVLFEAALEELENRMEASELIKFCEDLYKAS